MRKLVTAAVCAWLGGAAAPDGGLGVHVDFREPRFGGATQLLRHKPGNPSKTFGTNLTACETLAPPACVLGLDAAAVADARAILGAHAIRAVPCDAGTGSGGLRVALIEHPVAWSGGDAAAIARWNEFAGALLGDGARRAKRGAGAALVARAEDLWHQPRTVAAKVAAAARCALVAPAGPANDASSSVGDIAASARHGARLEQAWRREMGDARVAAACAAVDTRLCRELAYTCVEAYDASRLPPTLTVAGTNGFGAQLHAKLSA